MRGPKEEEKMDHSDMMGVVSAQAEMVEQTSGPRGFLRNEGRFFLKGLVIMSKFGVA